MASSPRLTLKKDRERSVLHRHPWIFSGGVQSVDLPGELPHAYQGGILEVVSSSGKVLGAGFYDGESQIRCRLFHFGESPEGGFPPAYWEERLRRAHRLRQDLLPSETTGYRLIHSESDGMPGLICDIYAQTAVIQLQHPGADAILPVLKEFLQKELGILHIYLHSSQTGQNHSGAWIAGENPRVDFLERGMKFRSDLVGGQKTGFFLDQRENRRLVEEWSRERTVLNAFSYTAAFSVAALRGGAKHVQSVDLSAAALELGDENVALNGNGDRHESIKEDCFEYLRKMEADRFDLIILDPPAFAKTRTAVDRAARGYKDINLQALKRVRSGGLVFTFSCSHHVSTDLFRKILFGAAADSGREVKILDCLTQAPDHPINIYHPEGEYLKGFLLRVD